MADIRIGRTLRTFVAACALSLCAAAPSAADTVTIKGTTDVDACAIWLDSSSSGGGCGFLQAVWVPNVDFEARGLLRFDVSAHVPATAEVLSAELRLPPYLTNLGSGCGLTVREQSATNWSLTPSWDSPDGVINWDGGAATWNGYIHPEIDCTDYWGTYDVINAVWYWVDGQYVNNGFEIVTEVEGTAWQAVPGDPDEPELVIEFED